MTKSAGLLMYRVRAGGPEFLIVHPGGPWWSGKNEGAWTIPKGEIYEGEEALAAARREFGEETGLHPEGMFIALTPVRLKSRKVIHAWAIEGDCDPSTLKSNEFEMEWPPKSGWMEKYPEVNDAKFCDAVEARRLLNPAQGALIDELLGILATR